MSFGKKLKAARVAKGLNQAELAKQLKTSRQAISRYEKSEREPSIKMAALIADTLGLSLNELIDADEKKPVAFRHELSPDEVDLLDKYRAASEEKRNAIRVLIKSK